MRWPAEENEAGLLRKPVGGDRGARRGQHSGFSVELLRICALKELKFNTRG